MRNATDDRTTRPEDAALVMIEFQNEWLHPDGKLFSFIEDEDQRKASVQGARSALRTARREDAHVIHVPNRFSEDYAVIGGGLDGGLFQAIPEAGTWTGDGQAFYDGFEPEDGEHVVKDRVGASAFSHSNLDAYLRNNGITDLFVAGYALHVCVESTLRQGHDLGYTMHVVTDATSAFTQAQRRHTLEHVVHHFGHAVTAEGFAERLRQPAHA
jgi:nicotinamidase-related amidase